MIALIGSTALAAAGHPVQPRDLDFVAPHDEIGPFIRRTHGRLERMYPVDRGKKLYARADGLHIEAEIAWTDSTSRELLDLIEEDGLVTEFRGETVLRASPSICLALKLSHRYRKNSPHFLKTMRDIQALRAQGIVVEDRIKPWLKRRETETYSYGHPSLKQTKANFFADDNIPYTWDHDTIHRSVMLFEEPAYEFFKVPGAEIQCSRKLFEAVRDEIRLAAVYEESCVLAIERSLVPHPGVLTPDQAWLKALEKVCTSITSGWFREYAWENYDRAVALYRAQEGSLHYKARFDRGVAEGLVQPHTGAHYAA